MYRETKESQGRGLLEVKGLLLFCESVSNEMHFYVIFYILHYLLYITLFLNLLYKTTPTTVKMATPRTANTAAMMGV